MQGEFGACYQDSNMKMTWRKHQKKYFKITEW